MTSSGGEPPERSIAVGVGKGARIGGGTCLRPVGMTIAPLAVRRTRGDRPAIRRPSSTSMRLRPFAIPHSWSKPDRGPVPLPGGTPVDVLGRP